MPKPRTPRKSRTQMKRELIECERELDGAVRVLNTISEFWRFCPEARCTRQRGCAGAAKACFERHWAMWSDETREWFRVWLRGIRAGLSPKDAGLAADAERIERQARLE